MSKVPKIQLNGIQLTEKDVSRLSTEGARDGEIFSAGIWSPTPTPTPSVFSVFSFQTHKSPKQKKKRNVSTSQRTPLNARQEFVKNNLYMKISETEKVPTTCYGDIEFKETTGATGGRFIRCADDTDLEKLFTLMTEYWELEKPRMLISVTGGTMSFGLHPHVKKDFQDGLLKVASTPGAWVVTGGTNKGVMKLVGDANVGTKNVCIGIVTWGIVAKRDNLIPSFHRESDGTFPYPLGSHLIQKGEAFLDYNHSHFILVDDGTVGKWGREIQFRGKFEEYIMQACSKRSKIPTVLVVLEGGPRTIDTVLDTAVKNAVPCVLIEGSGRAADLLAYAVNYAEEILDLEDNGKKHDRLVDEVMKTFNLNDSEKILKIYKKLVKCVQKKDIFTITNMRTEHGTLGTDDAILTALLKDRKTAPSHYEQLRLAILWDRVDLALKMMSKITSWIPKEDGDAEEELHKLMIMALAMDRVGFVHLFLGYGVSIKSSLTKQLLQFLYAYRCNMIPSTMQYEVVPSKMKNPNADYEDFLESLLWYKTEKPKPGLEEVKLETIQRLICNLLRNVPEKHLECIIEIPDSCESTFGSPIRQLFIWAVLNNMLDMALSLWEYEKNAIIAKALIGAEITNGLLKSIRSKMSVADEVEKSLETSISTYQQLSIDLLDMCHKSQEDHTALLITIPLEMLSKSFSWNWSCLDLVVVSEQRDFVRDFLSHNAVQGILNDVWGGSVPQLRGYKIIMCIFLPFLLYNVEIRTRKGMKRMIQGSLYDNEEEEEEEDREQTLECEENKMKEIEKLPLLHKIYLFHVYSPIVRFYVHTIGYIIFLMLFAYIATREKKSTVPGGMEILLIITVFGYAISEIYQLTQIDTLSLGLKIKNYLGNIWNQFDILCHVIFLVALVLRCIDSTLQIGHLLYAFDVSLWIIRLINILYIDPVLGPYVIMIGHMLNDLINFLAILLIFLLSYGIAVKAILAPTPDVEPHMFAILRPYFHIHGEYFLDAPEDNSTTWFGTPKRNSYAEPIALVYLGVYLLIANVLLLNLVIAIFNSTYEKIMAIAIRLWKHQRYGLILEYAQRRSVLCPPFSLIFHIYIFIKWLLYQCFIKWSLCRIYACTHVQKCAAGFIVREKIKETKKAKLRELESHCLNKLVRQRKPNENKTMTFDEFEKLREEMYHLKREMCARKDNSRQCSRQCSTEGQLREEIYDLKREMRANKDDLEKLLVQNKIYLQDILRKKTVLNEEDKSCFGFI